MSRELRALVAAARTVAPPHRPLIATDADGTLWEGDIGDDLFVEALSTLPLGPTAGEGLRVAAAEVFGPAAPAEPADLALAFIAAYRAGRLSIERICQLQAESLGDRPQAEFDALIETVARRVAGRIRPAVRVIVEEAASADVALHVVTGSLGVAVAATLRIAGLRFASVSGGVLLARDGHVLPELAGPIPLHGGKVTALESVGAWPPAMGMGDGGWDSTFLRGCAVPLLVHPSPTLLDAMVSTAGVMILRDGLVAPLASAPSS